MSKKAVATRWSQEWGEGKWNMASLLWLHWHRAGCSSSYCCSDKTFSSPICFIILNAWMRAFHTCRVKAIYNIFFFFRLNTRSLRTVNWKALLLSERLFLLLVAFKCWWWRGREGRRTASKKRFTRFRSSGSPRLLKRNPKHPISLTRLRPWALSKVTAPPTEGRQQRSTLSIYKKRESPQEW